MTIQGKCIVVPARLECPDGTVYAGMVLFLGGECSVRLMAGYCSPFCFGDSGKRSRWYWLLYGFVLLAHASVRVQGHVCRAWFLAVYFGRALVWVVGYFLRDFAMVYGVACSVFDEVLC